MSVTVEIHMKEIEWKDDVGVGGWTSQGRYVHHPHGGDDDGAIVPQFKFWVHRA